MLNETQQRFLERYMQSRGDQYTALDDLGLSLNHLLMWRENPEFEIAYRRVTSNIITHLRQESFLLATKKINEAVRNGIVQETITHQHDIDSDGRGTYSLKKQFKNLGVPPAYLKLAMAENAITKAIQTLANEGVIPSSIAKKILQRAELISNEMAESFEAQEDNSAISEQKIIAYIKQAVLQGSEE